MQSHRSSSGFAARASLSQYPNVYSIDETYGWNPPRNVLPIKDLPVSRSGIEDRLHLRFRISSIDGTGDIGGIAGIGGIEMIAV
jgi:hypothetical protein